MQAETHQEARLTTALACYPGPRQDYLALAVNLVERAGISQELVYSAMNLLDYALVAGVNTTKVRSPSR